MENTSFHILRICIYVYITEPQHVQLLSVPNPCPDITPSATIADMCTNDFANEDLQNKGTTTDSVALRVMTRQDGCTCEVSLQNQFNVYTIFVRRYDLQTSAAPELKACGLAIDIDYTSPQHLPGNKASIECTQGTNSRSVSLLQNEVLYFKSRIIDGSFSRGYCLQIHRQHTTGDNVRIQINCSLSNMQTTQNTTDAEIQDKTVPSTMQTTEKFDDAPIEDKTVSDTDSTLYIAIGVGVAVVVIALIVGVSIIIIRRKKNTNKNGIEVQPDIDSTDEDSDGLKYNCLYNASEQKEIMEGNYHIVELEAKQNRTGIQNFDSDYSAVNGNYSSVDIIDIHAKDSSKTDDGIKEVRYSVSK